MPTFFDLLCVVVPDGARVKGMGFLPILLNSSFCRDNSHSDEKNTCHLGLLMVKLLNFDHRSAIKVTFKNVNVLSNVFKMSYFHKLIDYFRPTKCKVSFHYFLAIKFNAW